LSLPVQLFIACAHWLLLSTYSKRYLTTAWNQEFIRECWIRCKAISNKQQPYTCVWVRWSTGTSVYISYGQLQQITQPHYKNWLTATKITKFLRNLC